jgi:hypothetical protein
VEEQSHQLLFGIAVAGLDVGSQLGYRLRVARVDQPLDHQVLGIAVAPVGWGPNRLGRLRVAHRDQDLRRVRVAVTIRLARSQREGTSWKNRFAASGSKGM